MLLNFKYILLFEKTYLIVLKDETGLKTKLNASTLVLIGSYVRKIGEKKKDKSILAKKGIVKYEFQSDVLQFKTLFFRKLFLKTI